MSNELKPCPFCGGKADIDAPASIERLVYCKGCYASIAEDATPKAIAAWNRRAPAVPNGWKLVPVEPTDAMLKAAAQTPGIKFLDETSSITQLRRPSDYEGVFVGEGSPLQQAWRAMLSASPPPPEAASQPAQGEAA
jgi:Lar family restriction alleviation protein